jgi:uncharacterized protein
MDFQNTQSVESGERTLEQTRKSRIRNLFVGPNGMRAGWRLTIFLAILAALSFLTYGAVFWLFPSLRALIVAQRNAAVLTPKFELVSEGILVFTVLLSTWIMSRIEKRPFGVYGMPLGQAFGKYFWQGLVWGFTYESLAILGIAAFGGFAFGGLALSGSQILKFAVLWGIGFFLVGVAEEFLFRGYAQYTLSSGIGFWPAAVLLSAVFGAGHLTNPNEGWPGAISVFLFGMFGCFTLRRIGSLWFAIGLHTAADFAETFVYSVPDSGLLATGHLLNSNLHGPRWLSGGSIGPEGSVISLALFAVAFVVFDRVYPARNNLDASPPEQHAFAPTRESQSPLPPA